MSLQPYSPIGDDCVINAIERGELTADNISFQRIRELCKDSISHLSKEEDAKLWESLDRGKAILKSASQLDKYSYTHGLMIQSQWSHVFERLKLETKSAHVIDYGCGQGLSTALFLDNLSKGSLNSIEKITLIEPSSIALKRAETIVRCYSAEIEIATINNDFDSFNREKAKGNVGGLTYHLFSNVLDIPGYDRQELIKNTFCTPGENMILAISHHRNINGGSRLIRQCKEAIDDNASGGNFTLKHSSICEFKCNKDQNDAIAFLAHLEVNNGSV